MTTFFEPPKYVYYVLRKDYDESGNLFIETWTDIAIDTEGNVYIAKNRIFEEMAKYSRKAIVIKRNTIKPFPVFVMRVYAKQFRDENGKLQNICKVKYLNKIIDGYEVEDEKKIFFNVDIELTDTLPEIPIIEGDIDED